MVFGRNKSSSSTTPSAPSKAAAACSELRAAYHECFNRWYAEKFAKGQFQKDDCADHWHKYRACLEVTSQPFATPLLPQSSCLPRSHRRITDFILLLCSLGKDLIFAPLVSWNGSCSWMRWCSNGGRHWIVLHSFEEGIA
jgi:hypothetical protein